LGIIHPFSQNDSTTSGWPTQWETSPDEAQAMAGDHPERPQVFLPKPYRIAELQAALEAARR
jgi:hypothetical protein